MSDDDLLEASRRAQRTAYAPYSDFRVGCAVRAADGRVYSAGNVENASYGLTVCAERVALFKAVSDGHRDLPELAVSVERDVGSAAERMPCGACRQVMAEFMRPDARVLVDGVGIFSLKDLLPVPFVLE